MTFSLVWAALLDPSKMFSIGFSLINPGAVTMTPVDTFYPPLDSVSYITDGAGHSFREQRTAPADEASKVSAAYDYCTMPHPHPDRYQSPPLVQNGSAEAQLVYMEYIQRHQRRTTYNLLPGGEVCHFNSWAPASSDPTHRIKHTTVRMFIRISTLDPQLGTFLQWRHLRSMHGHTRTQQTPSSWTLLMAPANSHSSHSVVSWMGTNMDETHGQCTVTQ